MGQSELTLEAVHVVDTRQREVCTWSGTCVLKIGRHLNQCLIETTGEWPTKVPLEGAGQRMEALQSPSAARSLRYGNARDTGMPVLGRDADKAIQAFAR